jgi:hypothetical protein
LLTHLCRACGTDLLGQAETGMNKKVAAHVAVLAPIL